MTDGVRTACAYCGVGCGIVAGADGTLEGDRLHPANAGQLCSKGAALGLTLDDRDRLTTPMIGGRPAGWDEALDLIAARFSDTIARHGPDAVAFYVSGQCLTEDYYVANKLMKGFIGSANIDTNSRLCMSSSVAGHVRAFGEDVVPGIYDDVECADLVVAVGSNTAWCHPVLFRRMMAARSRRGTKLVVIDPRRTATAEQADLHLALRPGSDVALFAGLLLHLEQTGAVARDWVERHVCGLEDALAAARAALPDLDAVAKTTDLDTADLRRFFNWFAATERTVTLYSQGVNQSSAGTDKVNAILNCHLATGRIGRPGMGPFSLTGQPNAMGGREVGGLANQLAAHLRFDDPDDRNLLRRFWNAPHLPEKPGLKAVDLFDAALDGRVKALWIIATNPAASMPRADRVRAALEACSFVVVSDCWPTETTRYADVVLPAAGWGEKNGTVTNSERVISRQRAFRTAPGQARPDWWMITEVARRMGFSAAFPYRGPAEIFREHASLSAFGNNGRRVFDIGALAVLSDAEYDRLQPLRWPIPAGTDGTDRLFADGGFPTPDGRAHCIPTPPRSPADEASAVFPLILNTGRLRDQWHTMTRTGRVPRLMAYEPMPSLQMHPDDAAALRLSSGDLARVATRHGAAVLPVRASTAMRPGEIFAAMHWTGAHGSSDAIGRLVSAACDPVSGQPELKITAAAVVGLPVTWRALARGREPLSPSGTSCFWARVPVEGGELYHVAGWGDPPSGAALHAWAQDFVRAGHGSELIELDDPARGTFRLALLSGGKLQACLFMAVGNRGALPVPETLADLFDAGDWTGSRTTILAAGRKATPVDRTVCVCGNVTEQALRAAVIRDRLSDVESLGTALGAGRTCGTCIPELKEILRDAARQAA